MQRASADKIRKALHVVAAYALDAEKTAERCADGFPLWDRLPKDIACLREAMKHLDEVTADV